MFIDELYSYRDFVFNITFITFMLLRLFYILPYTLPLISPLYELLQVNYMSMKVSLLLTYRTDRNTFFVLNWGRYCENVSTNTDFLRLWCVRDICYHAQLSIIPITPHEKKIDFGFEISAATFSPPTCNNFNENSIEQIHVTNLSYTMEH